MGVHRIPGDPPEEWCSLTHHTFLIGPWPDARLGAVHVLELDDPDEAVLILQPADVMPFIHALAAAATGKPVAVDVHDLDPGPGRA